MARDKEAIPDSAFLGELRLGRQLSSPFQVALGGLVIAAGLVFLLPTRQIAGLGWPAALAALLAGVILALTLVNVLELLGGSGDEASTYVLTLQTLNGVGAFLSGWSILASSTAVAAALLRAAAAVILSLFPPLSTPLSHITFLLGLALILNQVLQALPRRLGTRGPLVVLLVTLLAALLSTIPGVDPTAYHQPAPLNLGDLGQVTRWLALGYLVFEALLSSKPAVQDPRRNLPSAMRIALLALTLATVLVIELVVGLGAGRAPEDTAVVSLLAGASSLPPAVLSVLSLCVLVWAGNACLQVAARQLHTLSQKGGFPAILQQTKSPLVMPPLLFVVLGVLLAIWITWTSNEGLIDFAAGLLLLAMTVLNIAAIYSQATQPERRRWFAVPFHPLVPALAIAANLILLRNWSSASWRATGLWLGLGLLIYVGYARQHHWDALEGEVVFAPADYGKVGDRFRILVPIGPREEARQLILSLAVDLACQLDAVVMPLQVIATPDPLAIEESRRIARERNTLFQWSMHKGKDAGVTMMPITRLSHSVADGILDTAVEEHCNLLLMAWPSLSASATGRMGRVLDPVVRQAPCDVAVVAYRKECLLRPGPRQAAAPDHGQAMAGAGSEPEWPLDRILVATAGGPHAPLAMQLGLLVARKHASVVSAVHVIPPEASTEDVALGHQRIEETTAAMHQQLAELTKMANDRCVQALHQDIPMEEMAIEGRVVPADTVVSGIAQAAADQDMVVIGASEERLLDRVLFGTIPEQVARLCMAPVVMVKKYQGLPHFWARRLWDTVSGIVPALSREQQLEVYRRLRREARPDVDFFIMMGLSATIATFGLLQSSTAVIIGAMLVAPLFTPILALSLSVVRGDLRLLSVSTEAALKGIALAIGLAFVLAVLSPLRDVTAELASRANPNLFDLAVALVSGAAGAYALARKDVAASLPGVAIAAALVPPLCTCGVGLAMGDLRIAGGGLLLFATNLVAITLAGSIMLLLLGFRPGSRIEQEMPLRMRLLVTLTLLVLVTIPLAVVFRQSLHTAQTRQLVEQVLASQLQDTPAVHIVDLQVIEHPAEIEVTASIHTEYALDVAEIAQWQEALEQATGRPVRLRLASTLVTQLEPSAR